MLNPLLTVVVFALVSLGFGYIFGGGGSPKIGFGIIPGIMVAFAFLFWRSRIVFKDMQRVSEKVQAILTPQRQGLGMKQQKPRIDDAVTVLREMDKWRAWQPWIGSNVDGQIGMLYYLDKRFGEARPYLEKSFRRNWVARAMLGVSQYKKKEYDAMRQTFEAAVKASKKESLLWNIYAWCELKLGERDRAIAILNRAVEFVESDQRTKNNLTALQNGKKMKMKGWNEMWYQFHLEKPPTQQVQMGGKRKQSRRGLYR